MQQVDDVVRAALFQNQPFDFPFPFAHPSSRLRGIVRVPSQPYLLQLSTETLPLLAEEVHDLRLHQTLSAALRRGLSHQRIQKTFRHSLRDCRQLSHQGVLRPIKAVDFSVKIAFEGEGELSCSGLRLCKGQGKRTLLGGETKGLKRTDEGVSVGGVALSRKEPFRAVAHPYVDSVLTLAKTRELIFGDVAVCHDRTVETRLFFLLRRHFVHALIAEIPTKVFVFDAAFVVLRRFIFVVWPAVSLKPRLCYQKAVEFEPAFMDVNSGIIRFEGAAFFPHPLSTEGFPQFADGRVAAADGTHKLLVLSAALSRSNLGRSVLMIGLCWAALLSCRLEPFHQGLSWIILLLFSNSFCLLLSLLGLPFSLFLLFFCLSSGLFCQPFSLFCLPLQFFSQPLSLLFPLLGLFLTFLCLSLSLFGLLLGLLLFFLGDPFLLFQLPLSLLLFFLGQSFTLFFFSFQSFFLYLFSLLFNFDFAFAFLGLFFTHDFSLCSSFTGLLGFFVVHFVIFVFILFSGLHDVVLGLFSLLT